MKILLLALLAFTAVQPGAGRKPKRRRKADAQPAVSHQMFYQQDKLMTQEIEALSLEVKQHTTSTTEQQTS